MLLDHCYCPYIRTTLKYVHHFANITKSFEIIDVYKSREVDDHNEISTKKAMNQKSSP